MKIYTIWAFLLVTSATCMNAYHKMCYMCPQYGRKGDVQCLVAKYCVCNVSHPIHYTLDSADGRRVCHIRLEGGDALQVRMFLDKYDANAPITDEAIQGLLNSRKKHLKTVGLILRDFKYHNKDVTADQVRCALGITSQQDPQ